MNKGGLVAEVAEADRLQQGRGRPRRRRDDRRDPGLRGRGRPRDARRLRHVRAQASERAHRAEPAEAGRPDRGARARPAVVHPRQGVPGAGPWADAELAGPRTSRVAGRAPPGDRRRPPTSKRTRCPESQVRMTRRPSDRASIATSVRSSVSERSPSRRFVVELLDRSLHRPSYRAPASSAMPRAAHPSPQHLARASCPAIGQTVRISSGRSRSNASSARLDHGHRHVPLGCRPRGAGGTSPCRSARRSPRAAGAASRFVPVPSAAGASTTGPSVWSARVSAAGVTSGVSGSRTASASMPARQASSSAWRMAVRRGEAALRSSVSRPAPQRPRAPPRRGRPPTCPTPGISQRGVQHVLEHRQGERGALEGGQDRGEPSLRLVEGLHRQGDGAHRSSA